MGTRQRTEQTGETSSRHAGAEEEEKKLREMKLGGVFGNREKIVEKKLVEDSEQIFPFAGKLGAGSESEVPDYFAQCRIEDTLK